MCPQPSSSAWWPAEVGLQYSDLSGLDILTALTVRVNLFTERNTSVCSSEVNFYFLAGRTSIPMFLMALYSANSGSPVHKVPQQGGWGATSHSRLEEWGEGEMTPPNRPLPARGHDSPQPQILPPLSSTRNGPDMAGHRPPAILATAHGAAEASPCCSSVTLSALHTTHPEASQKQQQCQGRGGH